MVWASLVMLLVLAVRRPVARLFGAGPAYALLAAAGGALVAAAAAVARHPHPSFPRSRRPRFGGRNGRAAAADGGPGQWVPFLLAIWAGGAAALIVWQWLVYATFCPPT